MNDGNLFISRKLGVGSGYYWYLELPNHLGTIITVANGRKDQRAEAKKAGLAAARKHDIAVNAVKDRR